MKSKSTIIRVAIGVVLVGCGAAGIYYFSGDKDDRRLAPPPEEIARVVQEHSPISTSSPVDTKTAGQAQADFAAGMKAFDQRKLLEARTLLSKAYFSGGLSAADESAAIQCMELLAGETILSPKVIEGDPYTFYYDVQPGERLKGFPGIERNNKLHVPAELILKINEFDKTASLPAGRRIKLIRGPFHAVVDKKNFTMDVYLQRDKESENEENLPKVFIKRYTVGLGRDGSTPIGSWKVRLGEPAHDGKPAVTGKLTKAPWNPPPGSGLSPVSVAWGQSGYPLGKEGYWISLEGTSPDTEGLLNYGIHGTNEPESIGKEGSLGCIRMRDQDIEEVFWMLYEKWSTVTTKM